MKDYLDFVISRFSSEVPGEPHAILGIITELGELADCYKKYFAYGQPLDKENVCEELGDLIFYVVFFCFFDTI